MKKVKSMWPKDFDRVIRDEPWVQSPVDTLARDYDAVENHGWYRNLDPILDGLRSTVRDGDVVLDYAAGTGILAKQFLDRAPRLQAGYVLVDSSPKFLRLAYEKLASDERTAFRWIRYLKDEKRMQSLDEVLPESFKSRGVDLLCSTNSIHLYTGLAETLESWARFLKPGAIALVQSGNIANPNAPKNSWIIDETVERIQPIARVLVRDKPEYAEFRNTLNDDERMKSYERLRRKYFLPVRPLAHYLDALETAGLKIDEVYERIVDAHVPEWCDFLSAYHEGVMGWAGGSKRIDGQEPSCDMVNLRLKLLRESLVTLFADQPSFPCCWTYIKCRKRTD